MNQDTKVSFQFWTFLLNCFPENVNLSIVKYILTKQFKKISPLMYPAPHKICNLQYFIYEHNKGYDGLFI